MSITSVLFTNNIGKIKPGDYIMWNRLKDLLGKRISNGEIPETFTSDINKNREILKTCFEKVGDLKLRELKLTKSNGKKIRIILAYIENLVEKELINNFIVRPIVYQQRESNLELGSGNELARKIASSVINSDEVIEITQVEKSLEQILQGYTILLIEGSSIIYSVGTQGWTERNIIPPEVEKTVRGPKISFVENISINVGSIRRYIKSPKLKSEFFTFGEYTRTRVGVLYLEGVANHKIVEEVKKRLKTINTGQINGCTHIAELIDDNPQSIFDTFYETERVDVVTAGVLEGRIAILTDGCPTALLVPKLFMENFISAEDYYNRYWYTLVIRILRFIGFLTSVLLPGIYISIITFHQELLPLTLVRSVYASRAGVPFPIVIELLLFLFFFEAIREAGARIPASLGASISIVGALILGQAAINAGILSADGVIIGSITGIAIFLTPIIEFNQSLIVLRTLFILAAGFMGLYGISIIILITTLHLCSLRSFGIPFMSPVAPLKLKDLKDFIVRVPYIFMNSRPESIESENPVRQGNRPFKKFFFKYRLDDEDEEKERGN